MSSDFFMACAEARQSAAYQSSADLGQVVERLSSLACNAHQRTLIANVEVIGGAATGDRRLFQSGVQRLMGATDRELLETLQWFADLTVLGTPAERKHILKRGVVALCEPTEPALNFVEDPGLADARAIISGRWEPSPSLPTSLAREVRRWVAWAGLDAWLAWRRPEYLIVARHPSVRFSAEEEGAWEYALLEAVIDLAQGATEDACSRVRRLTRGQRLPGWAADRITRLATSYAPLAGHHIASWERVLPAMPLPFERAVEPTERAGAAFRAILDKNKHCDLMRVKEDVLTQGWVTFAYFVAVRPGHLAQELAQALLAMVKRPEDASCWPWPSRVAGFAAACKQLEDRRLSLNLLAVAVKALPKDAELASACAAVLEACGPAELAAVVGGDLWQSLAEVSGVLSTPKQMMMQRGGVWRAVVDGTNLAFAGKDKKAGGRASLARVTEAWRSLKAAGFEEIITWFDASTRYYLTDAEAGELARLHASGELCIVSRGSADPIILEAFFEAPGQTWIVTCDRFRQWEASFPLLSQYWPSSRLEFQIDHQSQLRWSRPLDKMSIAHG